MVFVLLKAEEELAQQICSVACRLLLLGGQSSRVGALFDPCLKLGLHCRRLGGLSRGVALEWAGGPEKVQQRLHFKYIVINAN